MAAAPRPRRGWLAGDDADWPAGAAAADRLRPRGLSHVPARHRCCSLVVFLALGALGDRSTRSPAATPG